MLAADKQGPNPERSQAEERGCGCWVPTAVGCHTFKRSCRGSAKHLVTLSAWPS